MGAGGTDADRAGNTAATNVHVALATDAGYAMPTAVAITSLIANLHPDHRAIVHVVHSGLSSRQLATIRAAVGDRGDLEAIAVDNRRVAAAALANPHGYPPAALYRLLLPGLLPDDVRRLVYLDGDVVVRRSIHELLAVDLRGAPAGAVGHYLPCKRSFAHHPGVAYVNTGVLVLDLDQWRRRDLGTAALHLLTERAEQCPFADQDAINELLGPELHLLDSRWNQLSSLVLADPDDGFHTPETLAALRNDPWIVHFSSRPKPWQKGGEDHPHAALWREYHARTDVGVRGMNGRDTARIAASKGAFKLRRLSRRHLRRVA
jgi:lipopolysaccharide biosynthesis glycosyltransferase